VPLFQAEALTCLKSGDAFVCEWKMCLKWQMLEKARILGAAGCAVNAAGLDKAA
jgi:hypothetical protein